MTNKKLDGQLNQLDRKQGVYYEKKLTKSKFPDFSLTFWNPNKNPWLFQAFPDFRQI